MLEDSENETIENNLLSRALPVAKLTENVDLSIAPTTGEDYLSRVRLEATKNEIVIAKNIDVKKFEKNRTPQYFQSDVCVENRTEFKAPSEWQCEKSAEFSQLRDRVKREKDKFLKNDQTIKKKIQLPNIQHKKEWYLFCFGKVSKNNTNSNEDSLTESAQGNDPSLSILYKMEQSKIVQLFDYLVEWVTSNGYSRKAFEWLYCLMCFVEKPLLPETHSSLRTLARECIKMRSDLTDVNDEKLSELNLFISLIGRYFQQSDLADN